MCLSDSISDACKDRKRTVPKRMEGRTEQNRNTWMTKAQSSQHLHMCSSLVCWNLMKWCNGSVSLTFHTSCVRICCCLFVSQNTYLLFVFFLILYLQTFILNARVTNKLHIHSLSLLWVYTVSRKLQVNMIISALANTALELFYLHSVRAEEQ